MVPEILSSHFTIVLAVGATGYIGLLHILFWRWGRGEIAHLWTSLFCLLAVGFQIGRYLQVHTADPAVAVAASRLQAAATPLLVCCLVAFARTLRAEARRSAPAGIALLGLSAAIAALCLLSDWVVPDATTLRTDWAGRTFLSVPMHPNMIILLPFVAGGFLYLVREVNRSEQLQDSERRVVLGCVGAWLILGVTSVGTATLAPWRLPALSQFSPLLIAIGLNYVLLHRDRRLQSKLEQDVGMRTQELGDSEARYRALVDNSPLGVAASDVEGCVIAANPPILKSLGVRNAVGLNLFTHPAFVSLGQADALRACLETGAPSTTEITHTYRSRKPLELRVNVAAVRSSRGLITGVQIVLENIEDQRRLEERLRQSQKMEAIGRLAAGIAHEINNPMAYVRSNLGMLQKEWSDLGLDSEDAALRGRLGECAELLEEAVEGVERTISIVRDVKEFSHNSGDARVPADVNEILEDSLRIATPRLGAKAISIERMYEEVPPLVCSPGQLQQIFLNLIVNAIQAVEDGGTLWLITRKRDDEILVRVEDDGAGMDSHTLEHLFDPFFTTKAAGEGTGLGLYISYEIVRMHGGDIQVRSTPGEGSAFEIRLPLSGVPLDAIAEDAKAGR